MKKLICVLFITAGFGITSINVSNGQEKKASATCCAKEKVTATNIKSGDCPMKAKTVALTNAKAKTDDPKGCPMAGNKGCPMAGTKDCSKANCPMKSGAVTDKKPQSKTGPVAEVKVK